jgi:hypothetical protein
MRKVRMGRAQRAARGAPVTHKDPMAAPLCGVRTVVLLPSVRMAEPHIVRPLTAVRLMAVGFTAVRSTGRGSPRLITVPLSRAWLLAP